METLAVREKKEKQGCKRAHEVCENEEEKK